MSLLRIAWLCLVELLVSIGDFFRGIVDGHEFWRELLFIPRRVIVNTALREVVAISTEVDVTRGLRVVHANFLGYDENAHRRGPQAIFAHYALQGIDRAIQRIWNAARDSHRRNYHVWIMSDHGQEHVRPYLDLHGQSIHAAVRALYRGGTARVSKNEQREKSPDEVRGAELQRSRWLRRRAMWKEISPGGTGPREQGQEPTTVAIGPVGFVYWPHLQEMAEVERVAAQLVEQAKVPLVLANVGESVWAWNAAGKYKMPDEANQVLAPNHPHAEDVARDLTRLCSHPDAGDFVICGWQNGERPVSFVAENGAHGGPGPNETSGFVVIPADAPLPDMPRETFRPGSLRKMAQMLLEQEKLGRLPRWTTTSSRSIRVVTYNVHSCIGLDGRLSPSRIARVLAATNPDVIALQELDAARYRSEFVHQAEEIARALEMQLHFHSSLGVEEEKYGNAVLSRLPMRLVRAGGLPQREDWHEPRGALWVELDLNGTPLQFITTHLGLDPRERLAQLEELLGPSWLGNPECRGPIVFCGDLNAGPRSLGYRLVTQRLRDVQLAAENHKPARTWYGPLPLRRIDHIFVSQGFEVEKVSVPKTSLSRKASDHLPLVADLTLTSQSPSVAAEGRKSILLENRTASKTSTDTSAQAAMQSNGERE